MSSIVDRLYSLVNRGRLGKNIGLPTGLPKLDTILYGIQRRHLTVIGGATGSGKSSYALYSYVFRPLMAYAEGKLKDLDILYFSFELSSEVLLSKLLSLYIYETFKVIMSYEDILSLTKPLTEEGAYFIDCARDWLDMVEDKLSIVDKPLTPEQIDDVLRQFTCAHGTYEQISDTEEVYTPNNPDQYQICILDHIGLIAGTGGKKKNIDETIPLFIYYRNIASITGVLVQQFNRNIQQLERKTSNVYNLPDLADFSDSSDTVNGAEAVIAIYDPYRDKQKNCLGYNIVELTDRARILCVCKNRFGKSPRTDGVAFYGEVGIWNELPRAKEIDNYEPYKHLEGERLKYAEDVNGYEDDENS